MNSTPGHDFHLANSGMLGAILKYCRMTETRGRGSLSGYAVYSQHPGPAYGSFGMSGTRRSLSSSEDVSNASVGVGAPRQPQSSSSSSGSRGGRGRRRT